MWFIQENIIETVENNPVLIDTKPETVENNPAQEVEFIIETPQIVQKPEIVTAPTLEIVNTAADTQNNTLTIINNPPQNDIPRNDTTGLVVNSVFSMVEQKNNAVTINNRAIYDANEEALRNQSAFKSEYDELFEFKAAAELSQRLSETKINDLNKSMGLNEKFFYINELFGGNSAKFRTCITKLFFLQFFWPVYLNSSNSDYLCHERIPIDISDSEAAFS